MKAADQLQLVGRVVGGIEVPDIEDLVEEGILDIQVRDAVAVAIIELSVGLPLGHIGPVVLRNAGEPVVPQVSGIVVDVGVLELVLVVALDVGEGQAGFRRDLAGDSERDLVDVGGLETGGELGNIRSADVNRIPISLIPVEIGVLAHNVHEVERIGPLLDFGDRQEHLVVDPAVGPEQPHLSIPLRVPLDAQPRAQILAGDTGPLVAAQWKATHKESARTSARRKIRASAQLREPLVGGEVGKSQLSACFRELARSVAALVGPVESGQLPGGIDVDLSRRGDVFDLVPQARLDRHVRMRPEGVLEVDPGRQPIRCVEAPVGRSGRKDLALENRRIATEE